MAQTRKEIMMITTLPVNTKGMDCNTVMSKRDSELFSAFGYKFAVRYVPRVSRAVNDVSAAEMMNILLGGLGIMLVQHVALPGWKATVAKGIAYGKNAARESKLAGYPRGCVLWLDLEEVNILSTKAEIIGYCNAWYDEVESAGYEPGIYVGYGCRLNKNELYHKLKFRRYWGAYNLNTDYIPVVRGLQMKQFAWPKPANRVAGISYQYDENLILVDNLGGSPLMLRP